MIRKPLNILTNLRLAYLPVVAIAVIASAGCNTLKMGGARNARQGDWLVDGATNGRERHVNVRVQPPLERVWLYNANAGFGTGSPLLYRDAVIVGNRKGELHAVEIETGRSLGVKNLGEAIEGSLLIRNGVLFATHAWGKYVLTAYDLNAGSMVWRVKGVPFETAPVAVDGSLVAIDVEGNIRSFNIDTGDSLWTTKLGARVTVKASPLLLGGNRMFVVSDKGIGFMFDATTGENIWYTDLEDPVYASPTANGDQILVPTTRGRLHSISSSDASLLWTFDRRNETIRFASPATDGSTVYVGTSSGNLFALDSSTGTVVWQFNGPDAITAAPLITDSHIYIGTMGRMLYGLDRKSGHLVWDIKLKGRIKSAMFAKEGELIVLTEPRYVYGFREEAANEDSL
ncbi:MAG: PQQ-binding-like beta-propeller repeat protein [Bacteroidetes bacterium]|nr:PQQ-binding-like beta-propeller repeat protein [Bacteroidota bacterium]